MLYEILELPPRKLATKEQIRRAYHRQSLRYHPDKVLPEEAEEAAEKFLAIKTAYELLAEGMETGGAGMAGAVFSGGDLGYSGDGFAATATEGAGEAASEGVPADLPGAVDAASQKQALQAVAAAHVVGTAAAESAVGEGGGICRSCGDEAAAPIVWLAVEELARLLDLPRVGAVLCAIAAAPERLDEFAADAVVMGLLHSLVHTHAGQLCLWAASSAGPQDSQVHNT